MTYDEAKRYLRSAGFHYLGSATICDCTVDFYVRRRDEQFFEVAVVDGWLGNHTPKIRTVDEAGLRRLCERIRAESPW